jgi:anti-sigma regulatory factor (Ser/Thr protein kinase)
MDHETHHTSRMFKAQPTSAAFVRRYVRESLDTMNLTSEEAVFLANELATNAIVHAGGEFVVEVSINDHTCRIGVIDHVQERPDVTHVDQDATSGRGLALVEALSSSWGVEDRADGKAVWCDVPVVRPG